MVMWYTIVTAVHVFSCFFLVLVVLLQTGKGADIGAVFGGSSQTIFGSSGAGNFLTKMTTGIAIVFMLTSLALTYGAAQRTTQSIFDTAPVSPPAPAAPSSEGRTESAETRASRASPEQAATPGSEAAPAATEQSPASTPAEPTGQ